MTFNFQKCTKKFSTKKHLQILLHQENFIHIVILVKRKEIKNSFSKFSKLFPPSLVIKIVNKNKKKKQFLLKFSFCFHLFLNQIDFTSVVWPK